MALLTLAQLLSDVQDEIPGKAQAQVVRAVNKVIRRVYTEFVEPVRTTFTTLAQVTTGTVSVTQDSTAVTFSSAVLASTDPVRLVKIDGDSNFFTLTFISTTQGTLSSKWAGATNATATFTIVYPTISFPAAVGEILSIQQYGYETLKFLIGGQMPWTYGIPETWSPYVHDESSATPNDDLLRIFLSPAPTTRIVYEVWYKPRVTFLDPAGATTQTIPLSNLWYDSVIQGVLFFVWKQERREGSEVFTQNAIYENALARARASALPAAVIPPRSRRTGMWAFEQRPVTDA